MKMCFPYRASSNFELSGDSTLLDVFEVALHKVLVPNSPISFQKGLMGELRLSEAATDGLNSQSDWRI
jgi:hypothetical protein